MARSNNRDKLLQALERSAGGSDGRGERLTVTGVARAAGVSRATANRDVEFLAAFKRKVSEAAADDAKKARSASSRRQLVADLRGTIDDMANVIQALSLAYEKLEKEVEGLRRARAGDAAAPPRMSGRRTSGG